MYAVHGCQVHLNQGILVYGIVFLEDRFDQQTNDDHHVAPHPSSPAIIIPFPLAFSHVVLLEAKHDTYWQSFTVYPVNVHLLLYSDFLYGWLIACCGRSINPTSLSSRITAFS